MPVMNLGTVFVSVSNLERSIEYYTQVLGLVSRGIEDWGDGRRGATLFFNDPKGKPMITLAEIENVHVQKTPLFNLNCTEVEELHRNIKERGHKVSDINRWESEWNNHIMFDAFDPDENAINLVEIQQKQV
jgi:lactoylglutathione lyase